MRQLEKNKFRSAVIEAATAAAEKVNNEEKLELVLIRIIEDEVVLTVW